MVWKTANVSSRNSFQRGDLQIEMFKFYLLVDYLQSPERGLFASFSKTKKQFHKYFLNFYKRTNNYIQTEEKKKIMNSNLFKPQIKKSLYLLTYLKSGTSHQFG